MRSNRSPKKESYSGQFPLIDTLTANGIAANPEGVCAGGSHAVIEIAFKTGSTRRFDELVELIFTSLQEYPNPENTPETEKKLARLNKKFNNKAIAKLQKQNKDYNPFLLKVFALQEKRASHASRQAKLKKEALAQGKAFNLTPLYTDPADIKYEQDIFDAYALLNQVQIFDSPNKYIDIFSDRVDQQDIANIAAIATDHIPSRATVGNNADDVTQVTSYIDLYQQQDLEKLIHALNKAHLRTYPDNHHKETLAFTIKNHEHQIALIYQNGRWHLTDLNKMPTMHYRNDEVGIKALAKDIHSRLKTTSSGHASLFITTFSKRSQVDKIKLLMTHSRHTSLIDQLIKNKEPSLHLDDMLNLAFLATRHNDNELLKKLIKQGLDVNRLFDGRMSYLMMASSLGHTDIVRTLIHAKADINAREQVSPNDDTTQQCDDDTALIVAIRCRKPHIAEYLLKHGADPDLQSNNTTSPLLYAVVIGDLRLVKALVEAGANLDPISKFESPFDAAVSLKKRELILYFTSFSTVKTTKLIDSLINNLLKSEPFTQANVKSSDFYTNMHSAEQLNLAILAAKNNDHELLKKLIKAGVDINATFLNNMTLLHVATSSGSLEIVKLLIRLGAHVNAKKIPVKNNNSHFNVTPLMLAANLGSYDIAKYLLKHAADPDIQRSDAASPLLMAVVHRNLKMVKLLIEANTEINPKCEFNTPYETANALGFNEIVEYLTDVRNKKNNAPAAPISKKDSQITNHSLFKNAERSSKSDSSQPDIQRSSETKKSSSPTSANSQKHPAHSARLYSASTPHAKTDHLGGSKLATLTAPQAAAAYTGADDSSSSHISDSGAKTDGRTKRK